MSQTNVATLPVTHEDLSDELAMTKPAATMFSSTCPRGEPAENTKYSAPVDKHKPGKLGGQKDGQSVDRANVTNRLDDRKKLDGVVQHFREDYGVSTLTMATMKPAGITNAYAASEEKALVTMKESMEMTMLSQQEQQEGSTAMEFLSRGASRWIDFGAQPNLSVDAAYRPASTLTQTVAGVSSITEANCITMLQKLYEAAKSDVHVMGYCTPDFGTQFDTFFKVHSTAGNTVPVRSFNFDGGATLFQQKVTSYATRFGRVDIIPSLHLNATRNNGSLAGASTTNTDATVTVTSTAGLQPFMKVAGTGIPAGAYIASITNGTTFELNAAATATGSPTLTLGELDHALFLNQTFFELKINQVPGGVDLTPDGSGKQGYCEAIQSLFCTLPYVHGKFNS